MRGRGAEEEKKKREWGKQKEKMWDWMDAQVLLLIDPGAELGWAELSDTLPSVVRTGEKCHQNKTHLTQRIHSARYTMLVSTLLSSDLTVFKINVNVF